MMKIEELQAHFKDYGKSTGSGIFLGCEKEVIIRTSTSREVEDHKFGNNKYSEAKDIVETHFSQVLEEENKYSDHLKYVRVIPESKQILDEDGEFTGHYNIRTRLQFGVPGKAITLEQQEHLVSLGWKVSSAN